MRGCRIGCMRLMSGQRLGLGFCGGFGEGGRVELRMLRGNLGQRMVRHLPRFPALPVVGPGHSEMPAIIQVLYGLSKTSW